jgi:hypothetical protein
LGIAWIGSEVDTLLAVYTGSNLLDLQGVASDDNSAPDGLASLVRFGALGGIDYLVAVDTPHGIESQLQVNWRLGLSPGFTNLQVDLGAGPVPVTEPPFLLTQTAGGSLHLEVGVSGTLDEMSYQWLHRGDPIPNASSPSFDLTSLVATNSGRYSLVLSNWFGIVTNDIAQLLILDSPPVLLASLRRLNGQWILRFESSVPLSLILEASPDLSQWTPVSTNAVPGIPIEITPDFLQDPIRFYRIRTWP